MNLDVTASDPTTQPKTMTLPNGHTASAPIVPDDDWGEQTVFCSSEETGLRAIIAIDSTVLGPAVGGTRMSTYGSVADATQDARRLAKAMTVKAALAGLPAGGGKAVIIADPTTEKTEELLRSYGRFVDTLGGRYVAAQDVGTTPADLDVVSLETPFVVGLTERRGGGGNPSPYTARGVFQAIRAVMAHRHRSAGLAGRRVMVAGVGSVGSALVDLLKSADAEVLVSDYSTELTEMVTRRHDVQVVPHEDAHRAECDVFAPCALGGVLTAHTIGELRCRAVVGAANNQIAGGTDDAQFRQLGIDYVPDFLANAGGLIAGTSELFWPPFNADHAVAAVDEIYERTLKVLQRSDADGTGTLDTAFRLAHERIAAARRLPHLARAHR